MTSSRPPWIYALGALILLLVLNLLLTPGFFHIELRDGRLFGSLIDILNRSAPVLLLSLGMTLVIATGGVDLSVGAIMAIVGAVCAGLIARPDGFPLNFVNAHGSVPLIVAIGIGFGILCGLFNGALVSRLGFQAIIATLLLMVAGRGIAQLFANGQIVTFDNPGFASIGRGSFLLIPNPIWICLLAFVLLSLLMRRTALGLFTEASGSNPVAARFAGIDVKNVILLAYVVSGICAAMAGLIGTADLQAADANNAGLYLELDAILAVSVGGTALTGGRFSLTGTVIGALLMQSFTTTILTRGVSPEATLVTKAVVVIAVCVFQALAKSRKAQVKKVAT